MSLIKSKVCLNSSAASFIDSPAVLFSIYFGAPNDTTVPSYYFIFVITGTLVLYIVESYYFHSDHPVLHILD